jgi:hypothetical protein
VPPQRHAHCRGACGALRLRHKCARSNGNVRAGYPMCLGEQPLAEARTGDGFHCYGVRLGHARGSGALLKGCAAGALRTSRSFPQGGGARAILRG